VIDALHSRIAGQSRLLEESSRLLEERSRALEERSRLVDELHHSWSWRITAPARALYRFVRGGSASATPRAARVHPAPTVTGRHD
jgi:hypothetical protein